MKHHESQEAHHAEQEVYHREQRALHAAELETSRERLAAFRAAGRGGWRARGGPVPDAGAAPLEDDLPPGQRFWINQLAAHVIAKKAPLRDLLTLGGGQESQAQG